MNQRPNPQYLAFDIEIATPFPEGTDEWKTQRPLGISCAATLSSAGQLTLWHGRVPSGEIAGRMNALELKALVAFLEAASRGGLRIVTWNGLGFDFDILAEESGLASACKALALDHLDLMFQIFCLRGYPLALDVAAKGMGLPGKPPGMSGELAPIYWNQGRRGEVLDYVAQDVRTTLDLARLVDERRALKWISKQGKPQVLPLSQGWLPVRQAMALPEPDTSWMTSRWERKKFTGWLSSGAAP